MGAWGPLGAKNTPGQGAKGPFRVHWPLVVWGPLGAPEPLQALECLGTLEHLGVQ
jgi:hypothetical protein